MQTTTTPAMHALHCEFTRRVREARQAKEIAERAGWYPRRTLEMLDEEIAALVGLLEHVERTIAPSERGETVNGGSLEREGRPVAETAARTAAECRCSLRTKLVGDGCAACNPERWADLLRDEDNGPTVPSSAAELGGKGAS